MLISVAPNKTAFGVETGDDWRIAPGQPGNDREFIRGDRTVRRGVDSPYVVTHLANALSDHYKSDAHCVAYVLRDANGQTLPKQPRVNKGGDGLEFVQSLGFRVECSVLFADVDNPGHCEWTEELLTEARAADARLVTAGVYYTQHGRRIVQPLTKPVLVPEVEGVLAAWLRWLHDHASIHADPACQDWTRHFRLPFVRRKGASTFVPVVSTSFMRAIEAPEPAPMIGMAPKTRAPIRGTSVGSVEDSPLADAFRSAGLLGPSLGRNKRAIKCPFRSEHTTGREFDSSSVLFGPTTTLPLGWIHCLHGHCVSRTQAAFIGALPAEIRARLPRKEKRKPARELVSAAEAKDRLADAFEKAPPGLSVVVSGCGTGKTEAAIIVAGQRKTAGRLHSKTVISVPTTGLAIEVADRARSKFTSVRRLFGVLSAKNPDGSPVCKLHDTASAISRGGLSVPWEFCEGRGREPCPHASTCSARGGVEGPAEAKLIVGPHQMLSQLSATAGGTGLVVIDEPPPLLVEKTFSALEVEDAMRLGELRLDWRYFASLRPALAAVAEWIHTGELGKPDRLSKVANAKPAPYLADAYEATGARSILEAAQFAFEDDHKGDAPPIKRPFIARAMGDKREATIIANVASVHRTIRAALLADSRRPAVVRLEIVGDARRMIVTHFDAQLHDTLGREGCTVIADASGKRDLPIYEQAVGYKPPLVEVYAVDGAEVNRYRIDTRSSSRRALLPEPFYVRPELVHVLRLAARWLSEDRATKRAALITFKPIKLALAACFGVDVLHEWPGTKESLDVARKTLLPAAKLFPVRPDLGSYGGIRGLDHWRDHDALITLGDPRPQLERTRWESQFLGLKDWEGRMDESAELELEQAHGRLRLVHRSKPARALHVGRLTPSGWAGGVEVRDDRGGRPSRLGVAALADLVGREGVRGAARSLGVSRQAVSRRLGKLELRP